MKKIPINKIKNILVTRTDRIGDVMLSTPAFEVLKKKFPFATITVLVLPQTKALVETNPYVDQVIVYDKRGKHKSIVATWLFAQGLRKYHFDCAVHLHPTNRVYLISFFAGIAYRLGYRRKMFFLLTHKMDDEKHLGKKHETEYVLDLLTFLGIDEKKRVFPFLKITQGDKDELDKILDTRGLLPLPAFFIMFPNASCLSKRWSLEKYARLAEEVYKKYGLLPVVTGGFDDKHIAQELSGLSRVSVCDLTGALSLRQLGALFLRAAFIVSNDSGPMHIAGALDVPLIALFGRSNPGLAPHRWKPLGKNSHYIKKDVGCVQCLAHNCKRHFLCLHSIHVDDVMKIVHEMMGA